MYSVIIKLGTIYDNKDNILYILSMVTIITIFRNIFLYMPGKIFIFDNLYVLKHQIYRSIEKSFPFNHDINLFICYGKLSRRFETK